MQTNRKSALRQTDAPLPCGLYIVATPIGNLQDITLRALDVLQRADVVACEDTRVTGKLLSHYGITAKKIAFHEHNAVRQTSSILDCLHVGQSVALVSDAGTPLVSDPGAQLVQQARAAGYAVVPVPGASSVMAALSASGWTQEGFAFVGFLPSKKSELEARLAQMKQMVGTLVVFEAPHRIVATLEQMAEALGDREAMVMRELTKMHEEALSGTLRSLAGQLAARDVVRGEIVVLLAPALACEEAMGAEDVRALLRRELARGSLKDATDVVAAATGMKRREVYQLALSLRDEP